MDKKAQNHVVLRGNVDGNIYVLRRIKGKGEELRNKQFLHKGKSGLCACNACSVVFEYLNIIT